MTNIIRTWSEKPHENDSERLKEIPAHTEVVEFEGPMLFASAEKFSVIPIDDDIKVIILRMRNVPALDATAMKKAGTRLGSVRKTVNPPYGQNHTEDYYVYVSNLPAANSLSKPSAYGKFTWDSSISGARGCSHLDGTK